MQICMFDNCGEGAEEEMPVVVVVVVLGSRRKETGNWGDERCS